MWSVVCMRWHVTGYNSISRLDPDGIITSNIAELTCHSWKLWKTSRWPRDQFVNLFGIVGKQVESAVSSHCQGYNLKNSKLLVMVMIPPHFSVCRDWPNSSLGQNKFVQLAKSLQTYLFLRVEKVYEDWKLKKNSRIFLLVSWGRRFSANRDVKV